MISRHGRNLMLRRASSLAFENVGVGVGVW